jgi:hypothetical protein
MLRPSRRGKHIIRDENELNQIRPHKGRGRQYIRDNAIRWENDKNNPAM